MSQTLYILEYKQTGNIYLCASPRACEDSDYIKYDIISILKNANGCAVRGHLLNHIPITPVTITEVNEDQVGELILEYKI